MDRLSIVVGAVTVTLLLGGCKTESRPPPPGRVVAVKTKVTDKTSAAGFCDEMNRHAPLPLPKLTGPRPDRDRKGPLWLNLWATWCKPCIAEMPKIVAFQEQQRKTGKPFTLLFVSVDEDPAALKRFYQSRSGFPASSRLEDPEALPGFLHTLGLDEGAGLPIHVFINPDGTVRCVRAAAINESHFEVISTLLE